MNIERMKNQTIGTEIEMANITREKATKVGAKYFGTEESVKHLRDSYDSWSFDDKKGRTWKVSRDVSIIARTEKEKAELITPILKYDDIEDLQNLIRELRKAGAISNPEHGCGVHIHIGADGHNAKTLRTLANIMAAHEEILINAINIDNYRTDRYCKTVDKDFLERLNKKKPTTMSGLADLWYRGNEYDRSSHYNQSRYRMLNLHATFTKGTIEFRLFQFDNPTEDKKGGLHAGQLKSYIQLCLALSELAKEQKSARHEKQQMENQKYAMRTWLLRLGFIGDEFKTAREVLTKRLNGDGAFRIERRLAA